MNLDERIQQDLLRGDYGTARVRLLSRLNEHGYSADIMARLGRVSFDMRDPVSAGRFWIFSHEQGPEIDSAIEAFAQQFGHVASGMASQFPQSLRQKPIGFFPPDVQARLRSYGIDEKCLKDPEGGDPHRPAPATWTNRVVGLMFGAFVLFILASMVVGAITIVRWMF